MGKEFRFDSPQSITVARGVQLRRAVFDYEARTVTLVLVALDADGNAIPGTEAPETRPATQSEIDAADALLSGSRLVEGKPGRVEMASAQAAPTAAKAKAK